MEREVRFLNRVSLVEVEGTTVRLKERVCSCWDWLMGGRWRAVAAGSQC
jgi:hypothetical protein